MAEIKYAFLKNNIVENIFIFDAKNDKLAQQISDEHGYDNFLLLDKIVPYLYSSYDGKTFIDPTLDYLYERGVSLENSAMRAERLAKLDSETL